MFYNKFKVFLFYFKNFFLKFMPFNYFIRSFNSFKNSKPKKNFNYYDPIPILFLLLVFYYDFHYFYKLVFFIYKNELVLTFLFFTPSCWILLKNFFFILQIFTDFFLNYMYEILPKVLAITFTLLLYLLVIHFFIFFAYLDLYYKLLL